MEREGRKRGMECLASADERPRQQWRVEDREEEKASPVTASDEEVEEFFAIIRRIHEATKMMSGQGGGRRGVARTKPAAEEEGPPAVVRWKPTFLLEDFYQELRSKDRRSPSETSIVEEEKVASFGAGGLDLNAEPEMEGVAVDEW